MTNMCSRGDNMNININLNLSFGEALEVLKAVHEKYIDIKVFFAECENEEDTIGLSTPEELKALYNNLLKQMKQESGMFDLLDFIK